MELSNKEVLDFIADVKGRLPIDKYDLEGECVRQVALYEEVSSLAGMARSAARRAKEALDTQSAKIQFLVRDSPEKFGIVGKPTEGSVSNAVARSEQTIASKEYLLDTEERSIALDSLLRTIEQRKSMIRDLVQLFIFQYYSQENTRPVAAKDLRQSKEDAITEVRRGNRRRRQKVDDSSGEADD